MAKSAKSTAPKVRKPLKVVVREIHRRVWAIVFSFVSLAALGAVFFVGSYYMFVVSQFAPTRALNEAGELGIDWMADGNILRAVLCVVIAAGIATGEGKGFAMARERPAAAGVWKTIGVFGLMLGMWMAIDVQMHHMREAIQRRDANASLAAEMAGQVRTISDTKLEEDAVGRAQAEYDQAIRWRDIANACPSGEVCEDVRPIQRSLGVRDDGIVRGAGVCANCGETAAAITTEVERARTVLDAATTLLSTRQAELRGGMATDVAKQAIAIGMAENRLNSLMGFAGFLATRAGNPNPADALDSGASLSPEAFAAAAERHDKSTENWLLRLGFLIAVLYAIVPNGLNFGFSNFSHGDEDEESEPSGAGVVDIDPVTGAVLAIGHDPNPLAPAGAGVQVDRTQARRYVAAGAPRQAWESHNDYLERLNEEIERLQDSMSARKVGAMHDEESARAVAKRERHLAIMRKQAEQMEEEEMAALEAQLGIRKPNPSPAAPEAPPVANSVAGDDRLHAVLNALERIVSGATTASPASSSVQVQPAAPSSVHQTVNVLPNGAADRLDSRNPVFIDLKRMDGESEDEALRRARRLADESACPIILDGRWMIWRDGTVLDRLTPGASSHPRWTAFRDYLKDRQANGVA